MGIGSKEIGKPVSNNMDTPNVSNVIPSHSHWVNVHVKDEDSASNINVLELIPVWLSLKRSAHKWCDLHVLCFMDNQSVLYV